MKSSPVDQFSEYMKLWKKGGKQWSELTREVYEERKRLERPSGLR